MSNPSWSIAACAVLGWAVLSRAGLGCAVLGWAVLGKAGVCSAMLCCAVILLCCAGLCCAVLAGVFCQPLGFCYNPAFVAAVLLQTWNQLLAEYDEF